MRSRVRSTILAAGLALAAAAPAQATPDRTVELSSGGRSAAWTAPPQTPLPGTYDPDAACPADRCDTTLVRVRDLPRGARAVLDVGLRRLRPAGPNQLEVAVFASDAGGAKGELLNRSFGFLASEELAPVAVREGHVLVEVHNGGSIATSYDGTLDLRLAAPAPPGPDGEGVPAVRVTRAPGAHLEPDVARDPVRPEVLVGVHERYPDPRARLRAARDVRAAASTASFDGGRTWEDLGDLTDLDGGSPRVAFDDAGTAYALTTATAGPVDALELRRWATPSRQDVAQGTTWEPPTSVIARDPRPAEPVGTDFGRSALAVGTAGPDDAVPGPLVACTSHVQTAQPVALVRCAASADGGRSFGPALPVSGTLGYGPDLAADPRDEQTFHAVWLDGYGGSAGFAAPGTADRLPSTISYARTTDGGRTWSAPVVAMAFTDRPYAFVHPPVTTLPRLAVGRDGRVHVVSAAWSATPGGPRPDVLLTSSDDGRRWSAPVPVHGATGASQDVPGIAVAPGGRVDVAFGDRRRDVPAPGNDGDHDVDERLAHPATGDPERRLSQRARDPQQGAVLRGLFTPNAVSPLSLVRAVLADDAGTLVVSSDTVPGEPLPQLVARRAPAPR